ncbi:MAG: NAD(P)H-dependent oxidoreductase subunit E [Proteobacteria bacterium]|nr:NAD(P)H-dependent oxidoreductase subunit E [Pseudomonadota bacterium]
MTREDYNPASASELMRGFGSRPEMLVQILHAFMDRFGWISEDAIRQLASELNLSRADVHGVVSYYPDFRTTPSARHIVKICAAEACQSMGSRALVKHAEESLQLKLHESNDNITLEPVYCLGNCACSPAIMANGKTFGRVSATRFDEIVAGLNEASS